MARGIPGERVTIIPNAVDTDAFASGGEPDAALRRRLGLDGETVIGFIGSFYAYEGLDLLIEALPRAPRACPRTTAAGRRRPQEPALKALAQSAVSPIA